MPYFGCYGFSWHFKTRRREQIVWLLIHACCNCPMFLPLYLTLVALFICNFLHKKLTLRVSFTFWFQSCSKDDRKVWYLQIKEDPAHTNLDTNITLWEGPIHKANDSLVSQLIDSEDNGRGRALPVTLSIPPSCWSKDKKVNRWDPTLPMTN